MPGKGGFQRKLDFSRDIQRLDITRLKLSTQSTLSLVPKIIGLLKHGGIRPQKQCCQLFQIFWETPDFGPYLPVSMLEYEIPPHNRRILPFLVESTFRRCLSYFYTVNIERFLVISPMPLNYKCCNHFIPVHARIMRAYGPMLQGNKSSIFSVHNNEQ